MRPLRKNQWVISVKWADKCLLVGGNLSVENDDDDGLSPNAGWRTEKLSAKTNWNTPPPHSCTRCLCYWLQAVCITVHLTQIINRLNVSHRSALSGPKFLNVASNPVKWNFSLLYCRFLSVFRKFSVYSCRHQMRGTPPPCGVIPWQTSEVIGTEILPFLLSRLWRKSVASSSTCDLLFVETATRLYQQYRIRVDDRWKWAVWHENSQQVWTDCCQIKG